MQRKKERSYYISSAETTVKNSFHLPHFQLGFPRQLSCPNSFGMHAWCCVLIIAEAAKAYYLRVVVQHRRAWVFESSWPCCAFRVRFQLRLAELLPIEEPQPRSSISFSNVDWRIFWLKDCEMFGRVHGRTLRQLKSKERKWSAR